MLALASARDTDEPVQTADLAERAAVPRKFLERILIDMRRAGIVRSIRGRAGGYLLARPPEAINFAEIVRIVDGPLALAPCASRTAYRKCADCKNVRTCEIRQALLAVRDATAAILERRTLAGQRA